MHAVMKPLHQTTKLANHFADPNEKVLALLWNSLALPHGLSIKRRRNTIILLAISLRDYFPPRKAMMRQLIAVLDNEEILV